MTVFQGAGYDWHRGNSRVPAEPRVDARDRQSIIRWLMWNDRNGCYSDADCDAEFGEGNRLTLEEARACLRAAFQDEPGLTFDFESRP